MVGSQMANGNQCMRKLTTSLESDRHLRRSEYLIELAASESAAEAAWQRDVISTLIGEVCAVHVLIIHAYIYVDRIN